MALKPYLDIAKIGNFETREGHGVIHPLYIFIGICALKALSVDKDCQGGEVKKLC